MLHWLLVYVPWFLGWLSTYSGIHACEVVCITTKGSWGDMTWHVCTASRHGAGRPEEWSALLLTFFTVPHQPRALTSQFLPWLPLTLGSCTNGGRISTHPPGRTYQEARRVWPDLEEVELKNGVSVAVSPVASQVTLKQSALGWGKEVCGRRGLFLRSRLVVYGLEDRRRQGRSRVISPKIMAGGMLSLKGECFIMDFSS